MIEKHQQANGIGRGKITINPEYIKRAGEITVGGLPIKVLSSNPNTGRVLAQFPDGHIEEVKAAPDYFIGGNTSTKELKNNLPVYGETNTAANERADSLDEAHDLTPIFSNLITAGQISTMNEGALDLLNGKYLEGTTKLFSPAMFGSGIGGVAARSIIGGYNLFNKNGVRKTYNLFNLGHYGKGALSLLGDAFNVAMATEGLGSISNALKGTSGYRNWRLSNAINKGVKENAVITAYNRNPAVKDIGNLWDYQSYLDNVFPNSKVKDVLWHGSRSKNLETFDTNMIGSNMPIKNSVGMYLTPERNTAVGYGTRGGVYPVLLNTETPFITNQFFGGISKNGVNVTKISPKVRSTLLANSDAVIAPKRGEIAFFNPDNALILGSGADVTGFRRFMSKPQITAKNAANITPEQWTAAQDAAIAMATEGLGSISNALKGTSGYRNWRLAREINLAIKNKPKYTKVPSKNLFRALVYKGGEITDPYSNFVTTDPLYAANYGKVTPYIFESKSIAKAKEPMMGSSDPVTMDMFIYNNTKGNPNTTAIIGHDKVTGEFTPSKGIEILNMNPKNLYSVRTSDSPTSLAFFERKPIKINLEIKESTSGREYVESPKDISSDVGNLIAEGSERSTYTSKSNPNIVYKIEDAPLDNIKNIKIRKEVTDDIIAPETTVGYYNRNGKYYRVTLLDKYKSWNPDDFDINYSPELDLEIIDALRKAKWNVELGTYNGAPYARTASKNGIKIGNLEYFNWGRDPHGNLKLIDLYVYSLKQGGKMNILEFLKKGNKIYIKPKNRGKFTKYCHGKVTSECIARGKRSSDPTVRKRATFALNVRRWKHEEGGKAFIKGINVLDSNPTAYKYVKKKYKMALEGIKLTFGLKVSNIGKNVGNWINNNQGTINTAVNGITGLISANKKSKAADQFAKAKEAEMKSFKDKTWKEKYMENLLAQEDRSDVVNMSRAYNQTSGDVAQAVQEKLLKIDSQIAAAQLKAAQARGNAWGGILKGAGEIAMNALASNGIPKSKTSPTSLAGLKTSSFGGISTPQLTSPQTNYSFLK